MSIQIRPVLMAILAAMAAFHVLPQGVDDFIHANVDSVVSTIVLIWAAVASYKGHKHQAVKAELESLKNGSA